MEAARATARYPGLRQVLDGSAAVVFCEREASDAAGAYAIVPSSRMGRYWADAVASGHLNVAGRPLLWVEPEGGHAAAAVTAGLSMTGLRATNFSSGQGIAYMHESLYADVGKRLSYVLNMGCRAMTKASMNVQAGHDDYHAVDDTGFFQVFAKNVQEVCDLNLIARRTAELALTPGIVAQDGFFTTHRIESALLPEPGLIEEFLGRPEDVIDTPTPAQHMVFGPRRRRVPEWWDMDNPVMIGTVQEHDAYMQSVAAQRVYFFAHVPQLADAAMAQYAELTGRAYARVGAYRMEDAEYVLLGQGSLASSAEAVADYLRDARGIRVGVLNLTMFRPFPGDLLGRLLKGRKGVAVLERTDQPLAEDLPIVREVRACIGKCLENGRVRGPEAPYPRHAAYRSIDDAPRVYSGCFGLGGRDLQPEGYIAAVENMLDGGAKRRFFYLSIDFVPKRPATPRQEIHQQEILDGYPQVEELALHGSENPDLMPPDSITIRLHSVGGWGAVSTGNSLATALFDLLGFDIKAVPWYGAEKEGQPTVYSIAAAPAPIRVNCAYQRIDIVLCPDPDVFQHGNPLQGLADGGILVLQSDATGPDAVWASLPRPARETIVKRGIRVFCLDALKLAREVAPGARLELAMYDIAFLGAFFRTAPVMHTAKLTEAALFRRMKQRFAEEAGDEDPARVEHGIEAFRRGFHEATEITGKTVPEDAPEPLRKPFALPTMLRRRPQTDAPWSDIHRFWDQTGSLYVAGRGEENLADPFIGLSLVPAATGVFRDMTRIRFEHPEWVPGNCTACGKCFTVCPDSAIPGLANSFTEVFDTAVRCMERNGHQVKHLPRALRKMEARLRVLLNEIGGEADVPACIDRAIEETEFELDPEDKTELDQEFHWFREAIGGFKFAVTGPYFTSREREAPGTGGLFSLTINPYACKGCMECVKVCGDNALRIVRQSPESVEQLRRDWEFWLDLPSTSPDFIRIDDIDERIGALETLLMDKSNYESVTLGGGSCAGCGEKTVVHLFTATVMALMQPRVKKHVAYLEDLIARLERHVQLKLGEHIQVGDPDALARALATHRGGDLTVARLSAGLDTQTPLDRRWLEWVTGLLAQLRHLHWRYVEGPSKRGRARLGMINATGCASVSGSSYPYNPYPFPWANHLYQDSSSTAMGVFEGHMAKMAEGFRAIRMAELEIAGEYAPEKHEAQLRHFDWRDFSDEEFRLCPPVLSVGDDGAMHDVGFQNLSRMMTSGRPIKVLVFDTQLHSAATARHQEEIRKEIALIAMAHRNTYVMQGAACNIAHLLEGFIEGVNARRPALFNIYSPCQIEHGVGDDMAQHQSRLAVESRAHPLYRYDPGRGVTLADCFDLDGNPAVDELWPAYNLEYTDEEGRTAFLKIPLTFADFAVTEDRFRAHFRRVPPEQWNDDMLPLAEFIELDEDEREGLQPYIWTIGNRNRLERVVPSAPLVAATEERRDFWYMLKGIAGFGAAAPEAETAYAAVEEETEEAALATAWIDSRACTACDECININPMAFAYDERKKAYIRDPGRAPFEDLVKAAEKCSERIIHPGRPANPNAPGMDRLIERAKRFDAVQPRGLPPVEGIDDPLAVLAEAAAHEHDPDTHGAVAPWIDSQACTACDECININPAAFAYNEQKKAVIRNPRALRYEEAVLAAEKCSERIIHPGYPPAAERKKLEKLVKRAERFMPPPAGSAVAAKAGGNGGGDEKPAYVAPWIDSAECSTCDECTNMYPRIFAYDDKRKAYIKDPKAGPYKDLVRAAERCTERIIHPGYPADPNEKGIARLIKRAEKFM